MFVLLSVFTLACGSGFSVRMWVFGGRHFSLAKEYFWVLGQIQSEEIDKCGNCAMQNWTELFRDTRVKHSFGM